MQNTDTSPSICDTCKVGHAEGMDLAGAYFVCNEKCYPKPKNYCPKHRSQTATEILRKELEERNIGYVATTDTRTYWKLDGANYDATESVSCKLDIRCTRYNIDADDVKTVIQQMLD